MTITDPHLRIPFEPVADPAAVVLGPAVRFTVLTPRLLRLEYNPSGQFEDRASQAFWYRRQPVPRFQVTRSPDEITITTDYLKLRYRPAAAGFSKEALSIELLQSGTVWHFGDVDPDNLLGTTRTLDQASGRTRLEPGLLSRSGGRWRMIPRDSFSMPIPGWRIAPPQTRPLLISTSLDMGTPTRTVCAITARSPARCP